MGSSFAPRFSQSSDFNAIALPFCNVLLWWIWDSVLSPTFGLLNLRNYNNAIKQSWCPPRIDSLGGLFVSLWNSLTGMTENGILLSGRVARLILPTCLLLSAHQNVLNMILDGIVDDQYKRKWKILCFRQSSVWQWIILFRLCRCFSILWCSYFTLLSSSLWKMHFGVTVELLSC